MADHQRLKSVEQSLQKPPPKKRLARSDAEMSRYTLVVYSAAMCIGEVSWRPSEACRGGAQNTPNGCVGLCCAWSGRVFSKHFTVISVFSIKEYINQTFQISGNYVNVNHKTQARRLIQNLFQVHVNSQQNSVSFQPFRLDPFDDNSWASRWKISHSLAFICIHQSLIIFIDVPLSLPGSHCDHSQLSPSSWHWVWVLCGISEGLGCGHPEKFWRLQCFCSESGWIQREFTISQHVYVCIYVYIFANCFASSMFSDALKKTLDTLVLTMSLKTMCFSLVELGLELMGSGASRKPQRLQTRKGRNVEGLIFKKH